MICYVYKYSELLEVRKEEMMVVTGWTRGSAMTPSEPLKAVYSQWAERFEKLLRMSDYPLAIKMVEQDEDIPTLAKRPLVDFGYHLNTCQCFAISRRDGEMIAQKQEDMWCHEAAIGFGFTGGKPDAFRDGLRFFLNGKTRLRETGNHVKIAKKWANKFPRFEPGKYIAILSAPLMRAGFEPDLVLLYVNPSQLNLILAGVVYNWGDDVTCDMAAHGGCVHYVVPPLLSGEFWVSSPCNGDILSAMKESADLVFSAPLAKVERLLEGMQAISDLGSGFPKKYELKYEGWLPPEYTEVSKIMKMHRALTSR